MRANDRRYLKSALGCLPCSLTGRQPGRGHVTLSGVSNVEDVRRPTLTSGSPLLDAAFGACSRPQPHVGDMSPTQKGLMTRASSKRA